jgi:predicted nuclease with TOPRIM domain
MTTNERFKDLEEQLTELTAKQADLVQQFARARIDQWQGRIGDLEVQVHLGASESNEHLNQLAEQLRTKWERVRLQLDDASSTASTVTETLLTGLESAYRDVRQALLESRQEFSR